MKTTQPRRYLVRPNQGLVAPNGTETVSILLVEKDKQSLLQTYERLGQSALDHSKDKFLVQSCAVSMEFAKKYTEEKSKSSSQSAERVAQSAKALAEALTSMWNAITSGGSTPVFNRKLHVRHTVVENATGASAVNPAQLKPIETSLAAMENMTQEQMFAEVSSLRRKYDELVSFSVNLTAERDILNNTLEQTKRDLNREMASRAAAENKGGTRGGVALSSSASGKQGSLMSLMIQLIVVAIACFLAGVKLSKDDQVGFLGAIPVVGDAFV